MSSAPEFETLLVEAESSIGRLTLNRPDKLNPLSTRTLRELAEAKHLAENLAMKSSLVLYSSKTSINAAAEAIAPAGAGWSDADSLVAALRDPESRERGGEYLQRVRKVPSSK